MAYQKIDKLDKQILRMIAEDARVPFLEVARACNVSGAAIHQRIQKLTNMGILKGSQFVIDPEKIGYETCAYIGLNLRNPENFDLVVKKLEEIPEVVECQYTTGDFDLFIKIYAVNNHHLLNIIHDKLQPLGLARSETIIAFNSVSIDNCLSTTFLLKKTKTKRHTLDNEKRPELPLTEFWSFFFFSFSTRLLNHITSMKFFCVRLNITMPKSRITTVKERLYKR